MKSASFPCLFVFSIVSLLLTTHAASGQTPDTVGGVAWRPAIQLSPGKSSSINPTVAVGGNETVHFTWQPNDSDILNLNLPYVRVIGGVMDPPKNLISDDSGSTTSMISPHIVASGPVVWIFFLRPSPGVNTALPISMIRSTDFGSTWERPRTIDVARTYTIYDAAADENNLTLLVPKAEPGGQASEMMLISTDMGVTWTKSAREFEDVGSFTAKMAISAGMIHLIHCVQSGSSFEIEYVSSPNMGNTWNPSVQLSNFGIPAFSPSISASSSIFGTEIAAMWSEAVKPESARVILRTSFNGGTSWRPSVPLASARTILGTSVSLGFGASSIAWSSDSMGIHAGGATATPYPVGIVACKLGDGAPSGPGLFTQGLGGVAVSPTGLHLVYESMVESDFRIFYRQGAFIRSEVPLTPDYPSIDAGTVELSFSNDTAFSIENSGAEPVTIGGIVADPPEFLSVGIQSTVIATGGSVAIPVRVHPSHEGPQSGKLLIYHDGKGSPTGLRVAAIGKYTTIGVQTQPGAWNLVSVPVYRELRGTLPSLFKFNKGYVQAESLALGFGYWAKPDQSDITYTGVYASEVRVPVNKGWNLIGSISKPLPADTLTFEPASVGAAGLYGYSAGQYVHPDSIKPGFGYWLKSTGAGFLILK